MVLADAQSLDEYIENVVMKMGEDAQGSLLFIIHIALRINIYIVNLDISAKQRVISFIYIIHCIKIIG